MSDAVNSTRTFVLAGHTGSGKTTLVDAILYKLGVNDRLGSPAAGSSMADYTDEEKNRKITIFSKPFTADYKSQDGRTLKYVFIDTPGYMDFFGQVLAAAHAAETGVVVIDAASGIQVGTQRVWKAFDRESLPRAIVVTGLDRDNTDFSKLVGEIQSTFGAKCVPVTIPVPDGKSVVDVLSSKEPPAAMADQIKLARNAVVEIAAETSDSLTEKYLGGEELTPQEVADGVSKAVKDMSLIPIFACRAQKDVGIAEFLEGVARCFPSPADREVKDEEGNVIKAGASEPFVGQVWRAVNDPFVGQIAFLRVFGGTLTSDAELINTCKNQKERLSALLMLNGRKQTPVTKATAGEIVAIPKLKATGVGDTLSIAGGKTVCKRVKFPNPVIFMCVTAKSQADEDKLGTALARVTDEDPTLKVDRNKETKETVISGLGDVHIDVAVGLMKSRSNVEVLLSTPKVPYRETVTALGEGHYKHKKQSGGRGQYGEVYLRVEPKKPEDPDWFVDAVVGGVIPGNFIPAVQKGVAEGMVSGAVAGYVVQDVKVTVYDGSYHEVDSSEISFKIAGSRAFKEAMSKARAVLLEPIMSVKVIVPDQYMGDINGDLNHRRGRILGIGAEDGMQTVTADVPQAELFRYAAELRSMTGGRGSFEMEFSRYDIVPSNIAQKIIAAAAANKEKEKED